MEDIDEEIPESNKQMNNYGTMKIGFLFSSKIDKQTQNVFMENFKGNPFFSKFNVIDNNKNFTTFSEFKESYYSDIVDSTIKDNNDTIISNDDIMNTSPKHNARAIVDSPANDDTIDTNKDNDVNETTDTNKDNDVNENTDTNKDNKDRESLFEVKFVIFDNEEAMVGDHTKIYKNNLLQRDIDDVKPKLFGIIFNSLTSYTVRFHENEGRELSNYLKNDNFYNIKNTEYTNARDMYLIEHLVDNAILKTLSNSNINIQINKKEMDMKGYSTKTKVNTISSFVPFFMTFYFVPCVCSLLNHLVIEKESRIKESLVIIGLSKSSFWISWAITYGIIIVLSSIFVTIAMYYFKFFIYIHWSVVIVVMVIYGLSCCCISFILSTIIKKSKTANTVGVMVIIGYFVMYFVSSYVEKSYIKRWICSFTLSPVAFIILFKNLLTLEQQQLKTTFVSIFNNTTLRNAFLALIFTLVIYFFIALYLDNVLPQGSNLHKKWHFFITDLFRRKHKKLSDQSVPRENNNPFIQEDPKGLKKAVEVKNIGKNFKVKRENIEILKNINFNAYYDEIFAILGHNGAGKTTLINIMTGILSSTRGEVYYDDVQIRGNETEICRQFGYCPQFDTFNNSLTVGEHVKLFAGIKGVKVDVKEILKDIDLLDKKDNYPKQLSGGQKRKLCITLALLGSPKYVFLDEPTTGLDPYSRKNIWELLSKKKKGCVTFVTTHYMDEADLLADRKMIISNGNITCLGTSLFLKNSFNMNYSLDVHTDNIDDTVHVDRIIGTYCPESVQTKTITSTNIQVGENNNNEISEDYIATYLLPMRYSKSFKSIFEDLNQLISNPTNGIKNFSLTAPTLEELFVRLENNDIKSEVKTVKDTTSVSVESNVDLIGKLEPVFGKTRINQSSSLRQIWSIAKLRMKIFIRNKSFALLYTLLPVCIIIGLIVLENKIIQTIRTPQQYEPMALGPKLYEDVKWFKDVSSSSEVIDKMQRQSKFTIDTKDYANELTNASGKLTPDQSYIGGFKEIGNDQFLIYHNTTYGLALPVAVNSLYNALLEQNNIKDRISVTFKPFDIYIAKSEDENGFINSLPEMMKLVLEPVLIVALAMAISLPISLYGPFTVKEREDGITHQLFLNGTKRVNYWIGVLISDLICVVVPITIIGIVAYIEEISIFHPKVIAYTIVITIFWGISSLLHQYLVSFFFKKYEKASILFVILNPILSLGTGIYAMIIAIIVGVAKESNADIDEDVKSKIDTYQYICYIILILYAPVSIVLFYTKISIFITARKISIKEGDILSFIMSKEYLEIMKDNSLSETEKSEKVSRAFFDMRTPTLSDLLKSKDSFIVLALIALFLIALYAVLLFFLEHRKEKLLKKNKSYSASERETLDRKLLEGPKDVYNEWKRVQQSVDGANPNNNIALKVYELNKDYSATLNELRKQNAERQKKEKLENDKGESAFQKMDNRIIYNSKTKKYINRIVDDVTFGVNVGECLGLLGPNGAGKTTSISMITGLLSHTHGKVLYGNLDLNETEMADLSLGYCSQHDSLWKLLTVKETIYFYLNICGYPKKDIPQYTKALIEACGIENHANKKVSEISGGTKRKLSLIVAICSSPSYLILDEPSAGMDPFTRRYMWKLISELKKARETATILTTHSTEEAEALCERIAILIKGRLVCVDTPSSIKMNHSNRYTLEVFTNHPDQFEEQVVKQGNLFGPDVPYELESTISYQKYTVTMKIENIANVFALMEQAKEYGLISQYNFGQYSLEQVFINFVNNV